MKVLSAVIMGVVCASQVMANDFKWVNVESTLSPNFNIVYQVDIQNITQKNGKKYFWWRQTWNGTSTYFGQDQVDCKKKMWQGVYLEVFSQNELILKKDSTNHNFPLNFFDQASLRDIRTLQLVCG